MYHNPDELQRIKKNLSIPRVQELSHKENKEGKYSTNLKSTHSLATQRHAAATVHAAADSSSVAAADSTSTRGSSFVLLGHGAK
jgi:hypothetical protein